MQPLIEPRDTAGTLPGDTGIMKGLRDGSYRKYSRRQGRCHVLHASDGRPEGCGAQSETIGGGILQRDCCSGRKVWTQPRSVFGKDALGRRQHAGNARAIQSRMKWIGAAALAVALSACQSVPVNAPCGVIKDDLKTVRGATPADDLRVSIHYSRGRAAGCWK